jgi:tripartite-type tricarboxylate transporter receptor subunit TctC
MMRTANTLLARAGVAAAMAALVPAQASADALADFYRGKQINLVVGYGTGGGYDVYARLIARYLGRYIPGNPDVIVQNMPGAASLRAVNYLFNAAPRDCTSSAPLRATCRCSA